MGPLNIEPFKLFEEAQKFQRKMTAGMQVLGKLDDVEFGVTAKEEVYREDTHPDCLCPRQPAVHG